MFAQSRDEVRSHFLNVWRKMAAKAPLQPMELILADVIERHCEYHALLDEPERALASEFAPDSVTSNPFLHMSLHVALCEQLQTDRPQGVVKAYNSILEKRRFDAHSVEHKMMDCLAASLWQSQRESIPSDEVAYMACLMQI